MAVWGIGAYYNEAVPTDKTQEFVNNSCACIGWDKDNAPVLHQMLKSIKLGDIIYVKSFSAPKKSLYIKAVGVVTDTELLHNELGTAVSVKWKKSFENPIKIEITPEMYRNNVYSNTLYEEYNKEIIDKLVQVIIEDDL